MSLNGTFKANDTKFATLVLVAMLATSLLVSNSYGENSINFFPKDATTEALTIYILEFSLEQPIPANANFRFTFPAEFDLAMVEIAGSSSINGGFEVSVKENQVQIARSGLGDEVPAGKKTDLKFALVKNPTEKKDDYPVTITILGADDSILLETVVNVKIK